MFNYDSTGIDPNGGSIPAPAGIYEIKIADATDIDKEGNPLKSKKSGCPMVKCRLEIVNAQEWTGTTFWHYVTFMPKSQRGATMAVQFLKTIGEPWDGSIDVDPSAWLGRTFKAKVKLEKDQQGVDRNSIAYLISAPEESKEDAPF